MTTPTGATIDHIKLNREIAETSLRLSLAMNRAREIQWEPSLSPKARDDVQRSSGGYNDPTGATVLDARRLELREAYDAAERATTEAHNALLTARDALERATDRWNG
jgi:hypothetical protein